MGLLSEFRRRNVDRMAVLYVVAAWLIMQVTEALISLRVFPPAIGPVTFTVLAIGFPISLIIAWYFEVTPEGLKFEKDVDRAESITHITGRRMDFIVIALLLGAVLLFAWHTWWPSVPPDKSIAVMAFENLSEDPDQEYFSEGISEELLNALAQVPGLRVISRSSSFAFKDKDVDIPTVAKQLKVAHVLEGSVRKSGNRVRITAQLIEARSDSHLWSETYNRDLGDIFTVQEEISAAIVMALKERLELQVEMSRRVAPTKKTEAHNAYLLGRYLVAQRTPSSVEGAIREFQKAIALDPDYALAHAELAMATLLSTRKNYADLTQTEAVAKAALYIERAMVLDPNLAEAHAASGLLLLNEEKLEEALPSFEKAIEINPNYSNVYTWMGNIYADLGHYKEEYAAGERALQLDPLSWPAINNRIHRLRERNRLAEAEPVLETLASIDPARAAWFRGFLTSLGGKWANYALGDLDAFKIDPQNYGRGLSLVGLSASLAILGLEEEALANMEDGHPIVSIALGRPSDAVVSAEARFTENPSSRWASAELAWALAAAGEYDRARPMLEEEWQRSNGLITSYGIFNIDHAAALIVIRQRAGEQDNVGEIVAAVRDNVRRQREAGITLPLLSWQDGIVAFLVGEREKGLALISRGAEEGHFIWLNATFLQSLYDDPGFAPIRAGQEARQVRERTRFLLIVCDDNPYEAVWRPAEGTCKRFDATGET